MKLCQTRPSSVQLPKQRRRGRRVPQQKCSKLTHSLHNPGSGFRVWHFATAAICSSGTAWWIINNAQFASSSLAFQCPYAGPTLTAMRTDFRPLSKLSMQFQAQPFPGFSLPFPIPRPKKRAADSLKPYARPPKAFVEWWHVTRD